MSLTIVNIAQVFGIFVAFIKGDKYFPLPYCSLLHAFYEPLYADVYVIDSSAKQINSV